MEPLSKPLTDWLTRLKLSTPAHLRRCRGRVRQLAKDLPAFDSVWIDALVHARKLTAFQAKRFESGEPEKLAVGPCVLVDQLGHGTSATYLARYHKGDEQCVLKILTIPEEQRSFVLESLRQLVARSENLSHPSAVSPKSCLAHGQDLVTVSRYVPGPSLNQLLVRRGRFPAPIVMALAKQLIDGCAAL
jgi:eukaryotic-like serine/threonine-protein kinase